MAESVLDRIDKMYRMEDGIPSLALIVSGSTIRL